MVKWNLLRTLSQAALARANYDGTIWGVRPDLYSHGDHLEIPLGPKLVEVDGDHLASAQPLECLQVVHPILAHNGPARNGEPMESISSATNGSSTVSLMRHIFGNSYGKPYVAPYRAHPYPFERAYLNMTVKSEGRQFDRLATAWLGDIEIFRTSTAEPTREPGISWHYMKDVSAFRSVWQSNTTFIFDLGNLVNEKYTGSYHVDLTVTFHNLSYPGPHPGPPDAIIPISAHKGAANQSSAFTFPQERAAASIQLPKDVSTAILTVAATGQGEEEFWWSNVPESAADTFLLSDDKRLPGRSSFREIQVRIDNQVVGVAWPFPVIFTGGIAPPLHRPLVGLQAFDLREYEIDITPWLGILCDGEPHAVSIEIKAINDTDTSQGKAELIDAGNHWVVSGKIFGWVDGLQDGGTTGEAPRSSLNKLNYEVTVEKHGTTGISYNQSISRAFFAESEISSSEGRRRIVWTQEMSMTNNGRIKHAGDWTSVQMNYSGSGISTHGLKPGHSMAFSYPIDTTYWYKTPDPNVNASLSVSAQLRQEMDITVLGYTPFDTGVEPFLAKLGSTSVSGATIHTVREGEAFFFQREGDKSSHGYADMGQSYALYASGVDSYDHPWSPQIGAKLYSRNVRFRNETKTSDREVVWDRDHDHPTPNISPLKESGSLAEFVPLSLRYLDSRRVFLNQDQPRTAGDGAHQAPATSVTEVVPEGE